LNSLAKQIWPEDRGTLTFEWVLLITLLVIGVVGGVSAVRDAIITELGDVASAAVNIDQSYTVTSETVAQGETPLGNSFGFQDSLPTCLQPGQQSAGRATGNPSQTVEPCGP